MNKHIILFVVMLVISITVTVCAAEMDFIPASIINPAMHFVEHQNDNILAYDYTVSDISTSPFNHRYQFYATFLSTILVNPAVSFKARILEPKVNRPGFILNMTYWNWIGGKYVFDEIAKTLTQDETNALGKIKESKQDLSSKIDGISPSLTTFWNLEDDMRFFVAMKYSHCNAKMISPELSTSASKNINQLDEFSLTIGLNMHRFVKNEVTAMMGYQFINQGYVFKLQSAGRFFKSGIAIYPNATLVIQPYVQWLINFSKE